MILQTTSRCDAVCVAISSDIQPWCHVEGAFNLSGVGLDTLLKQFFPPKKQLFAFFTPNMHDCFFFFVRSHFGGDFRGSMRGVEGSTLMMAISSNLDTLVFSNFFGYFWVSIL